MKTACWILLAALTTAPTLALAGSPPPPTAELSQAEMGALEQSIRQEVDAVGALVEGIDALLSKSPPDALSPKALEGHREAKRLYAEGKKLAADRDYPKAYKRIRAAKHAVMAAVEEIYREGLPMDLSDAVARQLDAASGRVDAIADMVAEHASPKAKGAWERAREHWRTGESSYRNGKVRPAFQELEACLEDLDVAIAEVWKARG